MECMASPDVHLDKKMKRAERNEARSRMTKGFGCDITVVPDHTPASEITFIPLSAALFDP